MKNKVENWQEEIERCKSFEYFYNNCCKRDGMPEYSEEAYQDYLKMGEEARHRISITSRTNKAMFMEMYPKNPEESFKTEE